MDVHEYARHDAVGLRELIATGAVSAAEVEAAAREALAVANASVNGLALGPFTPALEHAPDGPFGGVPFLIKDVPVAAGIPFTLGSRSLQGGPIAAHDSELMRRFRAAGLVTLGSTTVPEFAVSFATESAAYGVTANPWDLDRGVGGSSGGAAALVAAGAVPVAHGNDGAGSIRVPASCCGLVGLKPSRGRISPGPDAGDPLFGMSYDFVLTRTVRDTARFLDVLHGPGVGDKYAAPPLTRSDDTGPLRVALTTTGWPGGPVDPEVAAATEAVGRQLAGMGHAVEVAAPAVDGDTLVDGMLPTTLAGFAAPFLAAPRPPDPARLEAVSRRLLADAPGVTALELVAALDVHNRLTRAVGAFFTSCDLLVTPTLAQLPAPHGTLRYDDPAHSVRTWLESMFTYGPFTALFNITGQPAISLPLGWSEGGLPIGVQLVAPYGREDVLLRVAASLEVAMPWAGRVPPVSVTR